MVNSLTVDWIVTVRVGSSCAEGTLRCRSKGSAGALAFLVALHIGSLFLVKTNLYDLCLSVSLFMSWNIFGPGLITANLRPNSLLRKFTTISRINVLRQLTRDSNAFYTALNLFSCLWNICLRLLHQTVRLTFRCRIMSWGCEYCTGTCHVSACSHINSVCCQNNCFVNFFIRQVMGDYEFFNVHPIQIYPTLLGRKRGCSQISNKYVF